MRGLGTWLLVVVVLLTSCTEAPPGTRVAAPGPQENPVPQDAPVDHETSSVQRAEERAAAPGRLILQVQPEVADALNADAAKGLPPLEWRWPQSLLELHRSFGVSSAQPALPLDAASPARLQTLRDAYFKRNGRADLRAELPRLDAFYVLELPADEDLDEAIAAYSADDSVLSAEPDVEVHATADTFGNATQQWSLFAINAPAAWGTSTGVGVNVAVIDSGIDLSHPDLVPNLLPGISFVPYTTSANDDFGHGTHVAGIIAAVTNNTQGIAAVAPDAKLIPVKALNSAGAGFTTWLQSAYFWAMSTGYTDVINNSWGGAGTSTLLEANIRAAAAMGIITVNAAGNSSTTTYGFFPSNAEHGLSVAATDSANAHAPYSNTGVKLDVSAPGGTASTSFSTGVLSTVPGFFSGSGVLLDSGARYAPMAGTSMAAPHVSGLAALLIAAHPTWTVEQLRQAIRKGALDVGPAGFDLDHGFGRIDAVASLALPQPPSAQIIRPKNDQTIYGTATVRGFALPTPSNTATYVLQAGVGSLPSSWTNFASGSAAFNDAPIAPFNSTGFPDGDVTLRVITTNGVGGMTAEDRNLVHVDNVAIASPVNGAHLITPTVGIYGRVQGPYGLISWKLEWASGYNATSGFTTLTTSATPVVPNSLMTTWSLGPVPEGEVTLRLTAQFGSSYSTAHQINVIVDKRVLPGFPAKINDPVGFKTAKIVDLEHDGQRELVIGDSAYQANGALKPGWTANPRLGRTVPAIVNLDSTSDLEVVDAVFDAYFYDPSLPGGGAPVITAVKPNHSVLWTFPVTQTVGTFHNGTPSSVSIGNVTGDGRPEVVFTQFFAYNNPSYQTTVFVLDGATGAQLYRYDVPGFSWSAVALADLDGNGYRDLVFETYDPLLSVGHVYALHADGTAVTGWPQTSSVTQGFSEIAPVIGDVDGDCRMEVLVGSKLYRNNGTAFGAGWPVGLIARSTGAIANLDTDAPLELSLGGGNMVAGWYVENTGALNLGATISFENLYVLGFNENYKQGNPLLADVDGDGKIDLLRPAELGTTDPLRGLPLYAFDLLTGVKKIQTRRVRTTEPGGGYSFPIYSTPAVGDLNGDGLLDLVLVARRQVWAWNLGIPYVPAKAPWPMYQRDLWNTGTVPLAWNCPVLVDTGGTPITK